MTIKLVVQKNTILITNKNVLKSLFLVLENNNRFIII